MADKPVEHLRLFDRVVPLPDDPYLFLSRIRHSPLLAEVVFFSGFGAVAWALLAGGTWLFLFRNGIYRLLGILIAAGGCLMFGAIRPLIGSI